jgi:hypothetical protein
MMRTTTLPVPVTSDVEDVAVALETAQALWNKLDYKEAVRWVRRAAEAAEESGDDLRGVRLAAAAADLSTELAEDPGHFDETPSPFAGLVVENHPDDFPPPRSLSPRPPPMAHASRTAFTPSTPATASTPPNPPPPPKASSPPLSARASRLPLPNRLPSPLSTPAPSSVRPALAATSSRPAPVPTPSRPAPAPKASRPPDPTPTPPQSLEAEPPPSRAAEPTRPDSVSPLGPRFDGLRAFRVYVQRGPDGALQVRPLRDSEKVPVGAREAMLVLSGSPGSKEGDT